MNTQTESTTAAGCERESRLTREDLKSWRPRETRNLERLKSIDHGYILAAAVKR